MAETESVAPAAPAVDESLTVVTLADLSTHNTEKDCWMAINGKVYDVTKFLDEHPGGFDIMMESAGACFSAWTCGDGRGRCARGAAMRGGGGRRGGGRGSLGGGEGASWGDRQAGAGASGAPWNCGIGLLARVCVACATVRRGRARQPGV